MNKQILNTIYEAGRLLMKNVKDGKSGKYALKAKQSYVTSLDIQVEKMLAKAIRNTYPNHDIWGEEERYWKGNTKHLWVIDPLSNTRNFIHGLSGFAIAVGYIENNKPKMGFVYDPWLEELFIGEVNKGAYCGHHKIRVSNRPFDEHAFVNVDWQKRLTEKEIEEGIQIFSKLGRRCTVRAVGSVALTICYVAAGRMEAIVNNYSDPFAIIPALPIIREAGGEVYDFQGVPWNWNESKSTFAVNKAAKKEILECLISNVRHEGKNYK